MMTEPESIEKRQRFIMLKDKDVYIEGKDLDGISNPSPSLSNVLISSRLLNSPPKLQQPKQVEDAKPLLFQLNMFTLHKVKTPEIE